MASKIKVDNIENQCGGAVVTKCGATTTISGSVVKANDIQAADGGNLINQCGTTITLGASGDTINLAAGAAQSGFGRTGTVDWDTTAKTANFTAVSGNGYFVNTTSGAITMTLPATPSAGDIVAIKDYAGTFATNNLTIGRNGSNLDGNANDNARDTNNESLTLVYVDATQGWKSVEEGTGFIGEIFVVASGGTETTCGNYKIHTFTGPGTFCVSSLATNPANNNVDYLVVAGGGGTESNGGGGGAGGFRTSNSLGLPAPTTSPLATPTGITVSATAYPITVGAGGTAGTIQASPRVSTNGSNSIFSTITSTGGGASSSPANPPTNPAGNPGGSGGGASGTQGSGNSPPTSPPQGNPGGTPGCSPSAWSSGGGAGGAGTSAAPQVGGIGSYVSPSFAVSCAGTPGPVCGVRYFAGGGGGANQGPTCSSTHAGGAGGGGTGGAVNTATNTPGTINTGGGGGSGNGGPASGSAGGSGIVIIRYKYQ